MDIVIFGGFLMLLIFLSMIISKLDAIIKELQHLRNSTWKQYSLDTKQTKQELNAVKKSIWGAADKK